MSVIIDGTAGITYPSGGNPQAAEALVVQVVNATTSTLTATTSTSFVATTLTASITPKFSTSKIYVMCSLPMSWAGAAGTGIALYRNGSLIFNPSAQDPTALYYYSFGGQTTYTTVPLNYLDSPASTSSTAYKIYVSSYGGATSAMPFNGGTNPATASITLMEIAQ